MGRPPSAGTPSFRFLPAEVAEMEKALEASNGNTPARHILEALTRTFSDAEDRKEQLPIQYKQVWNWFQNRRHSQKVKLSKTAEKLNDPLTVTELPIPRKSGASAHGKKSNEVQELEFEAKSARDSAWYDVSMFLDHRISDGGKHEVRVRYTGFGPEEDEWVDIKTAVRPRSLPCEVLECVAVLPGDLILCFQEGSEQALYYDANILDVQRRRHDVRGCRCRFWVRYLHDQLEEVVPLRKVCRRPETEYRLKQQRSSKPSSGMEILQGSQVGRMSPSPDTPIIELPVLGQIENATLVSTEAPYVQSSTSHGKETSTAVTHTLRAPITVSDDVTPEISVAEGAANYSQDFTVLNPDRISTAVDAISQNASHVLAQSTQQQTLP